MKVIQVIPAFRLAGAEVMCENLCVALKNAGVDVIAVSLYSENTAITDRLDKKGVRIEYLDKKPGFDASVIIKLVHLFKKEKPDVVHTHIYASKYALPAAAIAGVKKKIHTVHSMAQKEQGSLGKKVNTFVYRHGGVVAVVLSSEVKKSIGEVYGLQESIIPVVYNGIDLSKCIRKNDYEANGVFTIVHVGRFMKVKNHKTLIRAFARFAEKKESIRLQLLGEGELLDEMKDYAEKLKVADKVEFLGLQSNVYEGVPMTLIEAMGTGLPIVASNVGGIPDMLVNGENALLVEPNYVAVEKAIEKLYNDVEFRIRLGNAAALRSEEFSAKVMASSYIKIYRS